MRAGNEFTRRSMLQVGAVSILGAASEAFAASKPDDGAFDAVFMTDLHIQPELGAAEGVARCIGKINAIERRPELVLTGGDLIMDALAVDHDRLKLQWKLLDENLKRLEIPTHHTIGNHDVGGWAAKAPIKPGDADFGKKYFADHYGKGKTYRSFVHKGWRFVILDSIARDNETGGYLGWVDDEQLEWLKADLASWGKTKPVAVVTHIPLFSTFNQFLNGPKAVPVPQSLINNAHVVRKIIDPYNVPLVLSGHGHILERIEFAGTTHLQGGAVSGLWWKGPSYGNPEGFLSLTFRPDGRFDTRYVDYGWKVVKS